MPTTSAISTLVDALGDATALIKLDNQRWTKLLNDSRRARLQGTIANQLKLQALWEQIPERAQEHLSNAIVLAEHHVRSIRWEVNRIERALQNVAAPVVLLKGAAYVMAELPFANSRLVNDVDILAPRSELAAVESALLQSGWKSLPIDEYDDHYYREWMHELPPMKHTVRKTVLDVHHTILPLTGRVHPDANQLLATARPLPNSRFKVLAPEDMILHASAHLFQDGEIAGGLRDLYDLSAMMQHYNEAEPAFWDRLVPRAQEHGLSRPLYYALRYTDRFLNTPHPDHVASSIRSARPAAWIERVMDQLCYQTLVASPEAYRWQANAARLLLYVRSHWLRMPSSMLLRHLSHKLTRRWFAKKADEN